MEPTSLTKIMWMKDAIAGAWMCAERSPCLKKKVGCTIIDMSCGFILAAGYGGAKEPCTECVRKKYEWQQDGCWSIHSEMRAIKVLEKVFQDYRLDESKEVKSFICVVTHGPCDQCLKYLHLIGIPLVVYDTPYHNDYSKWEGKIKVMSKEEYFKCLD